MQQPRFSGIFPPVVTPLLDGDTLDTAGLERLIEHLITGGVHGLFLLGTTGEGPSLSYRLRRELVERTCTQVRGRVPVLVAITDTSMVESIALAHHAAKAGAQAVVAAPPYYFPATQAELAGYFQRLADAVPLPLFLYNMPAMTKLVIELETVRACLQHPNIIGVKDSGGDLQHFQRLLEIARERPDWSVFMGPEHLMAEAVALGGQGGVNGGANVFPRLFVEQFEAAQRGDSQRVQALQERILQVGKLYQVGELAASIIQGLKCALSLIKVCDDFMAEPFQRFSETQRQKIRSILDEINRTQAV